MQRSVRCAAFPHSFIDTGIDRYASRGIRLGASSTYRKTGERSAICCFLGAGSLLTQSIPVQARARELDFEISEVTRAVFRARFGLPDAHGGGNAGDHGHKSFS